MDDSKRANWEAKAVVMCANFELVTVKWLTLVPKTWGEILLEFEIHPLQTQMLLIREFRERLKTALKRLQFRGVKRHLEHVGINPSDVQDLITRLVLTSKGVEKKHLYWEGYEKAKKVASGDESSVEKPEASKEVRGNEKGYENASN